MKQATTALLGLFFSAAGLGCSAPKYADYPSARGDARIQVPWGWNVYLEDDSPNFYQYNFVGPFDGDFFLGTPSLSVRWYKSGAARRLRDGTYERYLSADDFIKQTMSIVYGSNFRMKQPLRRIKMSGWAAHNFVVESLIEVPDTYRYGVSVEPGTGKTAVIREHAYAVLPMDNGFYVITYPATRQGFSKFEAQFNHMVNTFRAVSDGPGGPKI